MHCLCCITRWQARHKKTMFSVSQHSCASMPMTLLLTWVCCVYLLHLLTSVLAKFHNADEGPHVVKAAWPWLWWWWAVVHTRAVKQIAAPKPQLCGEIKNRSNQLHELWYPQGLRLYMTWWAIFPHDVVKGRPQPSPILVLSTVEGIPHRGPLLSRWNQLFKGDVEGALGPLVLWKRNLLTRATQSFL